MVVKYHNVDVSAKDCCCYTALFYTNINRLPIIVGFLVRFTLNMFYASGIYNFIFGLRGKGSPVRQLKVQFRNSIQ